MQFCMRRVVRTVFASFRSKTEIISMSKTESTIADSGVASESANSAVASESAGEKRPLDVSAAESESKKPRDSDDQPHEKGQKLRKNMHAIIFGAASMESFIFFFEKNLRISWDCVSRSANVG